MRKWSFERAKNQTCGGGELVDETNEKRFSWLCLSLPRINKDAVRRRPERILKSVATSKSLPFDKGCRIFLCFLRCRTIIFDAAFSVAEAPPAVTSSKTPLPMGFSKTIARPIFCWIDSSVFGEFSSSSTASKKWESGWKKRPSFCDLIWDVLLYFLSKEERAGRRNHGQWIFCRSKYFSKSFQVQCHGKKIFFCKRFSHHWSLDLIWDFPPVFFWVRKSKLEGKMMEDGFFSGPAFFQRISSPFSLPENIFSKENFSSLGSWPGLRLPRCIFLIKEEQAGRKNDGRWIFFQYFFNEFQAHSPCNKTPFFFKWFYPHGGGPRSEGKSRHKSLADWLLIFPLHNVSNTFKYWADDLLDKVHVGLFLI